MESKFHEGDEVRALVTDESGIWKDQKYIVQFAYFPEDVPESDLKEPLYSLRHPNGNSGMEGLESQLELQRTAKQMAARKLPSRESILQAFPLSWGIADGFRLYASDLSVKSNEIEFYGRTDEDLPFGFRVELTSVWETDD